jgi:predicted phage tail protein
MNTLRPAITPVATPATPTKPSVGGSLCRAAYVAGAAIFCGAYMATCGVGTVFTVGTITIPCVAVAVGACGIIGGSYQFLAEQSCKP